MPGIFTSVTMHIASPRPGQARAASAEEKTSDRPAPQLQHLPDGVPGRLVVVDDDDRSACPLAASAISFRSPRAARPSRPLFAAGSRMVKVAPAPGTPAASMTPLWSWTIAREMDSPRPWPPLRVV